MGDIVWFPHTPGSVSFAGSLAQERNDLWTRAFTPILLFFILRGVPIHDCLLCEKRQEPPGRTGKLGRAWGKNKSNVAGYDAEKRSIIYALLFLQFCKQGIDLISVFFCLGLGGQHLHLVRDHLDGHALNTGGIRILAHA